MGISKISTQIQSRLSFKLTTNTPGDGFVKKTDSNQKPTLEENLKFFRAFFLSLKAFFNLGSLKMICPNVNRPYLILWCLFLWIFQFLQFSHIFLHIFTQAFMTKGCKKCIPCNQLHFTGVKSVSYPITYAVRQRHNFQMSGCHGRLGNFFSQLYPFYHRKMNYLTWT